MRVKRLLSLQYDYVGSTWCSEALSLWATTKVHLMLLSAGATAAAAAAAANDDDPLQRSNADINTTCVHAASCRSVTWAHLSVYVYFIPVYHQTLSCPSHHQSYVLLTFIFKAGRRPATPWTDARKSGLLQDRDLEVEHHTGGISDPQLRIAVVSGKWVPLLQHTVVF